MKTKLKLDKRSIVDFFAKNGEKIAFATAVLCFFVFIYLATGVKRFNKTPEELSRAAQEAREHVNRSRSETIPMVPKNPLEQIQDIDPPTVTPYLWTTILDPPPFPPPGLRDQPELFPVEDLRAVAGVGRLGQPGMGMGMGMGMGLPGAAAGAPPQGGPLGQRWVVLTGLVDLKRYHESYKKCFQAARNHDPNVDFWPRFISFEVERAEVTDESESNERLKWKRPYGRLTTEYARYQGQSQDVVDTQRFVDPNLVFPLPPRFDGQQWGAEAAHDPKIPIYVAGTMEGGAEQATPGPATPGDDELDELGGGHAGPMGMPGYGGPGPGRPMGPMGGMVPMGPDGPMVPMGPAGPMGAGGGMMAFGAGQTARDLSASPYLLFRFLDYNVEPGKRYRYRVRLAVANPNYDYPDNDLVPELRERKKDPAQWKRHIVSDPSKASDMVFVPRDDRLLAVSVTPSTRGPSGTILAIHWDEETGEDVYDEFEVARGNLANFLDRDVPQPGPAAGVPGGPAGDPMMPPVMEGMGLEGDPRPAPARRQPRPRRGGPAAPARQKIDYRTEMVVLDLRGGERIPSRHRAATWPGEILVLDPDGTLRVHVDVKDEEDIERLKNRPTQPGGGMPGGFPGVLGPGF